MSDHKQTPTKDDPAKKDLPKHDQPKKESLKPETTSPDHPKKESLKPETTSPDHPKKESLKPVITSSDHLKKESLKPEITSPDHPKKESLKPESLTRDTPKKDSLKTEATMTDYPKKESLKQEPLIHNILKKESLKKVPPKLDLPKEASISKQPSKPANTINSASSVLTSSNTSTKDHEVVKIRMKIKRNDHHYVQVQHGTGSGISLHSRKSVHFRDGRKHDLSDSSMVDVEVSASAVTKGLVDVAYFETLMQDKELWVDHNYLSGFRNIFSADEVWLQEVYCIPCGLNTTYQITTKDENPVFFVKKTQPAFPSWFKSLICCPTPCCRNGFKVKIFSTTGTRLVTFIRKTHLCVSQLDIVETYYGKEEVYIGRIERSAHGYLLRDKHQDDIYRVLQLPTSERSFNRMSERSKHLFEGISPKPDDGHCCSVRQKEMKIFRSDTKEIVGRLAYLAKGSGRRFFSGCNVSSKSGFFCSPDMGTNAKVLLMGVLFFLMHSGHEKHVPFPLGSDATVHTVLSTVSSTSLDAKALSDASLDVLMKN